MAVVIQNENDAARWSRRAAKNRRKKSKENAIWNGIAEILNHRL